MGVADYLEAVRVAREYLAIEGRPILESIDASE
jgi:hypothetical protein